MLSTFALVLSVERGRDENYNVEVKRNDLCVFASAAQRMCRVNRNEDGDRVYLVYVRTCHRTTIVHRTRYYNRDSFYSYGKIFFSYYGRLVHSYLLLLKFIILYSLFEKTNEKYYQTSHYTSELPRSQRNCSHNNRG